MSPGEEGQYRKLVQYWKCSKDPDLSGDADHEDDGGPEEAAPEVAVHTVLEPV